MLAVSLRDRGQGPVCKTATLLGREPQSHSDDAFVLLGKDHVLEGIVVVGPDVCLGEDLRSPATEHKTEEALGGFVEVAGTHQTFIDGGVGGADDDRTMIHPRRPLFAWGHMRLWESPTDSETLSGDHNPYFDICSRNSLQITQTTAARP
jgi:hypothetical protein